MPISIYNICSGKYNMDEGHAVCVARCPPGKACTVANDNEGCFVGDTIPGAPTCCATDLDYVFLMTMDEMLLYSNRNDINVQNLGYPNRRKVYTVVRQIIVGAQIPIPFMGPLRWNRAPSWVPNGYEALDFSVISMAPDMPSKHIDDLLKVMAIRMPKEGFYAKLSIFDIERQPRSMRENINLHFVTNLLEFVRLPLNAASLAASLTINVVGGNGSGHRVVSMILRALADTEPMDEANISIEMTGPVIPVLNRRNIRQVEAGMQPIVGSRRFRGTIRLVGENPQARIVDPLATGVRQVSGKTLTADNNSLVLTIP